MKSPVLLIDGDILCYRAAAATDGRCYTVTWGLDDGRTMKQDFKYKKDADLRAAEVGGSVALAFVPEPPSFAIKILNDTIGALKKKYNDAPMRFYLSGNGSFRNTHIDPLYKMNRATMRTPTNLADCKQYLLSFHNAELRAGEYEADDLIAMAATAMAKVYQEYVVVSIDKDLKQIPGRHYNFVTGVETEVSSEEADRNFYQQLLTGDDTDGIIGLRGVGPKTAEKLLKNNVHPFQMYCTILKEWMTRWPREDGEAEELYHSRVIAAIRRTARLLYLVREEGVWWEAPSP